MTHESNLLVIGPPCVGKSTLAACFVERGWCHYDLDIYVWRIWESAILSSGGDLADHQIDQATYRMLESLKPNTTPWIIELPHHDYKVLFQNVSQTLISELTLVVLFASTATIHSRNLTRPSMQIPWPYIKRCIYSITEVESLLPTFQFQRILRFDTGIQSPEIVFQQTLDALHD